ncbi:hypothetical protein LCGC14_0761740 [marine sediment metagenome]|uniref:Uncharacterized protein n=1 Tax=marine sediment metagenome TaxID=412755 RepID=A0A0F9Q4Z3_9ZZZZ|nr:hypothetical protein [bacterium]
MYTETSTEDKTELLRSSVAIVIPALQAIVSGLLAGLAAGSLAPLVDLPSLDTFLVVSSLIAMFAWFNLLRAWREAIIPTYDKPTHRGYNSNVRLEIGRENSTSIVNLPVSRTDLKTLAMGLDSGLSFSESSWTGRGALFSRSEFRQLRDVMIKRKLLQWVNPYARAQGLELTRTGRAVMRYLSDHSPTLSQLDIES